MNADNCVCILARTPERGKVKRRLAVELGEAGALAAHEELLRGTLNRVLAGRGGYDIVLWLTRLSETLPDWLNSPLVTCRQQVGGGLGARMCAALEAGLADHSRCVLIGSDCPDIDADYLESAFAALARSDVVVGPAEDGGYGLIGLRRPVPELFSELSWGTEQVLHQTLEKAAGVGASVTCLAEIYDVDEPVDWRRYRADADTDG